jgi:hypothetical protein
MMSLFLSLFSFRFLTLIKCVVGQTAMSPSQASVHLSSEVEEEEHRKPCCFNKACPSKITQTLSRKSPAISRVNTCKKIALPALSLRDLHLKQTDKPESKGPGPNRGFRPNFACS